MNIINAVSGTGITQNADGSGQIKLQANGVTTNALAWVKFAGATGVIAASYNVSSITRNAAGNYTVNFANALQDANYVTLCSARNSNGGVGNGENYFAQTSDVTQTTTASYVCYGRYDASALLDPLSFSVAVFGN